MLAMRILTYNIRAGRGMDFSPALERQAAVIRALAPDIVALQEVDRATRRSGGIDQVAVLAGATGLHASFARSIDFEGGQYGIAILFRERPGSVRVVPLPSPHDEYRVLLVADFGSFVFAATHLSLHDIDRAEAVDRVLAELLPAPKPVFLAGDWNALPDDNTLRRIGRGFVVLTDPSVPTFPAAAPDRCIDYIAVDRTHADVFRGAVARVVDEPSASDHRPVLLVLPDAISGNE